MALDLINDSFPNSNMQEEGMSNIGASVGDDIRQMQLSILVALIGILSHGNQI